jgi:hypothetical protein
MKDVGQIDVINTDFAKAFDRVNIESVIGSLESYGICGSLLKWFESFLCNRIRYVSLNKSTKSGKFEVVSGVPQGSHCAPTLFNLVLNHAQGILEPIKGSFYADDAKLILPIKNINCCHQLQEVSERFSSWCKLIGLDLNAEKCKIISFSRSREKIHFNYTINGVTIERVEKINDLGVFFNEKFNFNDDSTFRVAKVGKSMMGFIRRQT